MESPFDPEVHSTIHTRMRQRERMPWWNFKLEAYQTVRSCLARLGVVSRLLHSVVSRSDPAWWHERHNIDAAQEMRGGLEEDQLMEWEDRGYSVLDPDSLNFVHKFILFR